MNLKKLLAYLAPFAIVVIAALFLFNLFHHGQIEHPGKAYYENNCSQCHGKDGEGIKELVPPFSDKEFITANWDSIPCWLKNGMNHPITVNGKTYDQPMYPNHLDDIQAANVINYLNKEFAGMDKDINSAWVREKWGKCK